MATPKTSRDGGAPGCPSCGADLDGDEVICPSCDHILDSTFLEGVDDGLGDEDTDPRMSAPPLIDDDEQTDPGASSRSDLDDDHPTLAGSLDDEDDDDRPTMVPMDDDDDIGELPTKAGSLDDDPYSSSDPIAALAPDETSGASTLVEDSEAAIGAAPQRPVPEPPPTRGASTSASMEKDDGLSKEVVTDTAPRRVPPRRPGTDTQEKKKKKSSRLLEGMDLDSSSELLDDYENQLQELWKRFIEVPVAEKIMFSGIVLGLMAVFLCWRVVVFEDGTSSRLSGFGAAGWINILLAVGVGRVCWHRHTKRMQERSDMLFLQLGLIGLALGWSAISFLIGLRVAATAPDFQGHISVPTAGPGAGVILSMLAWAIAFAGAILLVLDARSGKTKGPSRK